MWLEYLYEPFSHGFMVRSLIVAVSVGVMLPLLGSYVINRNLGFMGDAIAHASLPALVFGLLMGVSIFVAAIPAAIVIALMIGYLINRSKIGEDTAIGIIFSTLFALGFILLSIFNTDFKFISQISLRFYFDLTSISLRFHLDFTSISLRVPFDFDSILHRFYFDRLGSHFEFTSISCRFQFDFT